MNIWYIHEIHIAIIIDEYSRFYMLRKFFF